LSDLPGKTPFAPFSWGFFKYRNRFFKPDKIGFNLIVNDYIRTAFYGIFFKETIPVRLLPNGGAALPV
jgi:hypothetical protein